jgi:hypothetical protein
MKRPGQLETKIARFVRSQGGTATSREIARAVLGVKKGSEAALGKMLERLLAPRPLLLRRNRSGWELLPGAPAAGKVNQAALEPVVIAAADLPRGALRPARLAFVAIDGGEIADEAAWPGRPARDLRRLARRRAVLVTGVAACRDAVSLWLGGPGGQGEVVSVLSLDRLLRRIGERVPRGPTRRKDRVNDSSEDTPLDRCRTLAPLIPRLTERMAHDGVSSWAEALPWLENRPTFDFTGRAFDRATLRSLPTGPGVYRFFDSTGELVYVGQSTRLRTRVSSYFRPGLPPKSRMADIAARAHRIEVIPEGSDLAAQVREASEIRRLRPAINRQRTVRERAPIFAWRGDRVFVLPSRRRGGREVFFVKDGEVLDRRSFSPGPASRRRAEELLSRYFFGRTVQLPLPGQGRRRGGRRPAASVQSAISRRMAAEAGRLLSTWLKRRGEEVLSFDPGESAGATDAARRLLAYLEADPAEGAQFIR